MKAVIFLVFFLLLLISVRFLIYYTTRPAYRDGERIEIKTRLLSEPKVLYGQQIITVENIQVFIPDSLTLSYADKVKISGTVREQEKNGRVMKVLKDVQIDKEKSLTSPFFSVLALIRERIVSAFHTILPSQDAGLLLGIVLGVKDGINGEFYTTLRNTGVLHVVAASGANVVLVGGAAVAFFGYFFRRQMAILLTIGILFLYAFLSGFDAPIVRATLMGVFSYSAGLLGRQNYPFLGLFFACFLMLFFAPQLLFDVGFQLSLTSTLGILILKPVFDLWLRVKKIPFIDDVTTTLAAQGFSLPVLLSSFSSYSALSIFVNIAVLWTIPILMLFGGIAAVLSIFSVLLAIPFLYLAYPFLVFFRVTVSLFGKITAPFDLGSVPGALYLGLFCLIVSLTLKLRKKYKLS